MHAALLRTAAAHHAAGRLREAVPLYRRTLVLAPALADGWHALGVAMLQAGRPAAAVGLLDRAVRLHPDRAGFRVNLAHALADTGAAGRAAGMLRRTLAIEPGSADAEAALGLLTRSLGSPDQASRLLGRALCLAPGDAAIAYNLALTVQGLGRPAEAVPLYDRAIARAPHMLDALNNRGRAMEETGRGAEALADYDRVLAAAPDHAAAWNNRGSALRGLGREADAAHSLRRALRIDPGSAEAAANLGSALWATGDEAAALSWLARAAVAAPDHPRILALRAGTLSLAGDWDAGEDAYAMAVARVPGDAALALRRALTMPQVPESTAQIAGLRHRLATLLAAAEAAPAVPIADPVGMVGLTGFYLAYHGEDDRPLQQALARFHLRATPGLAQAAPHCRPYAGPAGRRIRVGICSRYLNSHTIGLLFGGVIERLDRDRFEVVVIRPPGRHDAVAARIDAAADRVLAIPGSLQAAQSVIAEARLDVLLYTDIGMEPLTYFLGFARLAPVQCVTWGHPDTTGIPAIDYYLSCAPFEPADAASHYAERLIRLPGILMDYRPPAPPGAADRADFGLDPARPLLLCPQNVFKLHPDFDGWLAAILRHAPDVQLALMEGQKPGWTARLRRRLAAAAPDVADRIRMVPVQPTARFFQLLTAADAILDPTHFGGGNTTFHALSLGLPIVTARGRFMRDRFVQGTYALLGIDGPVVDGSAAYAAAAADLSREPDRRAALSRAILAAAPALTDGSRPLRALERFLEAATDAARRGDLVADRAW